LCIISIWRLNGALHGVAIGARRRLAVTYRVTTIAWYRRQRSLTASASRRGWRASGAGGDGRAVAAIDARLVSGWRLRLVDLGDGGVAALSARVDAKIRQSCWRMARCAKHGYIIAVRGNQFIHRVNAYRRAGAHCSVNPSAHHRKLAYAVSCAWRGGFATLALCIPRISVVAEGGRSALR